MDGDQASGDGRPPVRVSSVPGKGRGVVATRRIAEAEVILRDPVLVIPGEEWGHLQHTVISRYCFSWHDERDDSAIVLGVGSLLNHSYQPNACAYTSRRERVIEIVALRDIEAHEEVTINYNPECDALRPMDFRVRGGRRAGQPG